MLPLRGGFRTPVSGTATITGRGAIRGGVGVVPTGTRRTPTRGPGPRMGVLAREGRQTGRARGQTASPETPGQSILAPGQAGIRP
eukprot:6085628-Alexandrium_andersonii.AAC.1